MSAYRRRRSNRFDLNTLKVAALTLSSILVAFGLCEITIRILGTAPDIFHVQDGRYQLSSNPLIGYEMVPNYKSDEAVAMVDFTGQANSLGFRDREHPVKKPGGRYRILVLGDSITQGMGIDGRADMFTSVLEHVLIENGHDVDVLNFGVNGYNTRQEVEILREKGLQYQPDLVVVAYCVNDNYLDSGGIIRALEQRKTQQSEIKIPRVFFKSAFFRQIWAVVIARTRDPLPFESIPDGSSNEIVPGAFADLKELADQHNFAVMVAAFPQLKGLENGPNPALLAEVRKISSQNGFLYLDLSTALSTVAKTEKIYLDDLHPNRRGSRCVGETLADDISTRYLDSNG